MLRYLKTVNEGIFKNRASLKKNVVTSISGHHLKVLKDIKAVFKMFEGIQSNSCVLFYPEPNG